MAEEPLEMRGASLRPRDSEDHIYVSEARLDLLKLDCTAATPSLR